MSENNISEPKIFKRDSVYFDLLKSKQDIIFVNSFDRQVRELFIIDNKEFIGKDKSEVFKTENFKKYSKKYSKKYCYIFYPWNNTVVKCVKEDDYFRLKTNRNQDLITSNEQEKLYKLKVAVLGMSVGSNIAFVLTQAGISKEIILADFDELDTTNLNRIWAGVHQIGLNKAVIASRRIYEDNPFAKVTILTRGVTSKILKNLLENKKLDLIVEEIDSMDMKIETRKLAMKYKKPVLMVTDNGDWAVLHTERYDLGYRKIFDKKISYWKERMKRYSGRQDFADIVINDIVGGPQNVDPKMLACAKKVVEHDLVSWPQLGSSALLGGIAVTITIKKIISGESKTGFSRDYIKII